MELLVGIVMVTGLAAIAARFLLDTGSGHGVVLPRVVDDSIGMWILRRMTGRPLGDRRRDETPAGPRSAGPRPFDAAMARRIGIRPAGEVVPAPRALAGAWIEPSSASDSRPSARVGLVALGSLVVTAIVVGLAVGAGLAVIVPRG